jgi:predicted MFS family arabinose efflux permease
LFIGVFVDRGDKKRWMLWSVALQMLLLFSLFAYSQLQTPSYLAFYAGGFCLMMFSYGYINARISSVKWALPTSMMTSANAKFTFIQTLMQVMGPAISGAILFLSSLYYGLLITAVLFLCALLVLTRLELHETPRAERPRQFWKELHAGWQALRQNRPLWALTWFVSFFNATAISFELMVIFYVKDELLWSTARVGIVLSCAGVGGLVGSVFAERLRAAFGLGTCLAVSLVVLALTYSLTGLSSAYWTVGVAMFSCGFMTTLQNICIWAYRHETTAAPLMGRVSGMTGSIFKIGVPLALLGSGVLADMAGARAVFVVCGVVQVGVFIAVYNSIVLRER